MAGQSKRGSTTPRSPATRALYLDAFQAKKSGYEQKERRHNRSGHDAKLGRVWSGTVRGDSGHPTTGPLYLLPFSIGNPEVKLTN